MLVLSRRVNEEIVIDGHITVMVCAVQGDKVRLGIKAPRDIEVNRREVAERIAAALLTEDTYTQPT